MEYWCNIKLNGLLKKEQRFIIIIKYHKPTAKDFLKKYNLFLFHFCFWNLGTKNSKVIYTENVKKNWMKIEWRAAKFATSFLVILQNAKCFFYDTKFNTKGICQKRCFTKRECLETKFYKNVTLQNGNNT